MNSTQTSQTDVQLVTAAERARGVEAWFLLAAPDVAKAREEWRTKGAAILKCGRLFSAVRIPGAIVRAAADEDDRARVDAFLADVLHGGPVFVAAGGDWYYALVAGGTGYDWPVPGIQCLDRGIRLGVPAVQLTTYEPGTSYWSVPMDSPGDLCHEGSLTDLIGCGLARLATAQQQPSERGQIS
ncbi:hypothetical protein OHV08_28260 [Streptomyces canus]|uniref:hypothetical protein n=1 Tax=Streptomyces canus TaxID=58343 RepID=UPI00325116CE